MKTIGVQSRIVPLVMAILLLLPISPVLAGGPPDAQLAMAQGSRSPGSPVPATKKAEDKHRKRVEVTFTVWVLNGGPFKAGFTGGDIEGDLVGEIFENVPSKRVPSLSSLIEVIYEVQAGEDRSFTMLLQGGSNRPGGNRLGATALLDGFILTGWRTGAQVHVEWVAMASPSVDCGYPAPDGAGPFCFVGTITVERAEDDNDDDD